MDAPRHYCTYFDYRYLPRFLALYASLREHGGAFCIWALCFDDMSYQKLLLMGLRDIRLISHDEFIRNDGELRAAQKNRSIVEYYFTCSPCLPLYVLNHDSSVEQITYLDADLFFFNSPESVFDEIGGASIAIIPHRFPAALRHLEENGIFNVGWITFRKDVEGNKCLQRWREQCLEWCYDRIEGKRFADQGYLTDWPITYQNIAVITQKGANLAPWNVSSYKLSLRGKQLWVDEDPLIFFHFQSLARVNARTYKLNFTKYRARASKFIKTKIYAPYVRLIEESTRQVVGFSPNRLRNLEDALSIVPGFRNRPLAESLRDCWRLSKDLVRGDYMFSWEIES
jgi:hypothetical protein